jgi:pyrimidine operon attenuation protein/uracil phosphoribosyltransferase
MAEDRRVLDGAGITADLERLASEILANGDSIDDLAIIGIRRRGVPIAERIAKLIAAKTGEAPRTGVLDITLYRDDLSLVAAQPVVHGTEIDFATDDLRVVLTDDVLFTGRTVRAAIDALFALGRPKKVELAVLVDRGFRELPIEATYVGETVETDRAEIVHVHLTEIDGKDLVEIVQSVAHAPGGPQ